MTEVREAKSLVDELVHQFSDSFAFYRELIQNSLDAGSKRVEVTLSFRPSGDLGLCLARVADFGEGMDRRIIEDYLVTKFRSTKEDDLTKIGKFGIGFVSVFACAPDAVTVDTGKDGQSWRVLFRPDLSYTLLASPEPFEGTAVTVHKKMTATEYAAFVARSKSAIHRWCRHSEADITFAAGQADGSPPPPPVRVFRPLTVDAPFQVELEEDGTHVVAGPARKDPAPTGFYNRGLTLKETTERVLPGVALKIASRYLEHTLTREDVRRDRHFEKAMALARRLVDGPLLEALPAKLEDAAERKDGGADWRVLFDYALERLPAKALWLRNQGGGASSLAEVKKSLGREKRLVIAPEDGPLVQRVRSAGGIALELSPGPRLRAVAALVGAGEIHVADAFLTYVEPPGLRLPAFTVGVLELLRAAGAKVDDVVLGEVRGAAREDATVAVESLGRPIPVGHARAGVFKKGEPNLLVFNTAHLSVHAARPLLEKAPRLAAVLLARLVLVEAGRLDEKADRRLTEWGLG